MNPDTSFDLDALPSQLAAESPLPPAVQAAFALEGGRLETQLKGHIGFAARHLQSGETVLFKADQRFPMASTYKIAIAGAALGAVDQGRLALDTLVEVTPEHRRQTGDIADGLIHAGVRLSLANLIEIMMVHSNNNATDRVLDCVGGPAAVSDWLAKQGVNGMRVDRSVNELLGDFVGLPRGTAVMEVFLQKYPDPVSQAAFIQGLNTAFEADPRDSATPSGMLQLLCRLFSTTALESDSRAFLLATMKRCRTGGGRLRGLLPANTVVADKTGTIGGTINDAGLIALPDGAGHIAVALFTSGSSITAYEPRERCLAEVARSLYDFFRLRHATC